MPELWVVVDYDVVGSREVYGHACEDCATDDEVVEFMRAGFDARDLIGVPESPIE